jgi:hypothetical protein
LKDLKIYFTDEGLRLCALIKLHDMLPEISAEAVLVLESFDFKPGMHIFIFRLKGQPKFSFAEQSNKVYVGFLRYIFENVVGPKRILESIGRALNEMDFLIWDEEREGRVTLDLDKHPEAQGISTLLKQLKWFSTNRFLPFIESSIEQRYLYFSTSRNKMQY